MRYRSLGCDICTLLKYDTTTLPLQRKKLTMGIMTMVYGLGQIIGPIVASGLYEHSHNFSSSLIAAAAALLVAALVALRLY
jgi:MFS family permease